LTDELQFPPKNGRIDKYSKKFAEILKKIKNVPNSSGQTQFEIFMCQIFRDCKIYLNKELGVSFPNILLIFIYNEDEYAELVKKLNSITGKRPYSKAILFGSRREPKIYINVQDHRNGKPINFIINLCVSFIEELVHIIDLSKSEQQIHDLVCSMLEGFLETKLPENVKQARLRYAKEFDEMV
jgi:hypothetical protein